LTEKIDYSKLADRVVEQAVESAGFHLNDTQVRKLVQNKIDRAKAMIDARKNSPAFHIDY
jgi:hypothetical protein